MTAKMRVNPIACSGHGLCAELLPELITLDEWGYPVIADEPVPSRLGKQARRAVTDCPALALRLAAEASWKQSAVGRARRLTFRRNSEPAQTGRRGRRRILES